MITSITFSACNKLGIHRQTKADRREVAVAYNMADEIVEELHFTGLPFPSLEAQHQRQHPCRDSSESIEPACCSPCRNPRAVHDSPGFVAVAQGPSAWGTWKEKNHLPPPPQLQSDRPSPPSRPRPLPSFSSEGFRRSMAPLDAGRVRNRPTLSTPPWTRVTSLPVKVTN